MQFLIKDRQETMRKRKEQLQRAQARMKKFADRYRTERKFSVGDWV